MTDLKPDIRPTFYQEGDLFVIASNHREKMSAAELLSKLKACRDQEKIMTEQLETFRADIKQLERFEQKAKEIFDKEQHPVK